MGSILAVGFIAGMWWWLHVSYRVITESINISQLRYGLNFYFPIFSISPDEVLSNYRPILEIFLSYIFSQWLGFNPKTNFSVAEKAYSYERIGENFLQNEFNFLLTHCTKVPNASSLVTYNDQRCASSFVQNSFNTRVSNLIINRNIQNSSNNLQSSLKWSIILVTTPIFIMTDMQSPMKFMKTGYIIKELNEGRRLVRRIH